MADLSSWNYFKKLTIDSSKVDSDLTDFPVLVKLTDSNFDFSKAESDGKDIRFTDDDQSTLLKFERESHILGFDGASDKFTGGTVTSSSEEFGADDNAFDDDVNTSWFTDDDSDNGGSWVKYDLGAGNSATPERIRINPWSDSNGVGVKDFILEGSNDDSSWTTLVSATHGDNTDWESFDFSNSNAYRYFRITVTSNWRGSNPTFGIDETEILERTGSTGEAYYWVKVPTITSGSDKDIYIYYGNSGASDSEDASNVWDSNFKAVYHLKADADGTAGEFNDSTPNNNDAQGGAGNTDHVPSQVDGRAYKGQQFDGSDDRVSAPDSPDWDWGTQDLTLSFWIKPSSTGGNQAWLGRPTSGTSYFYFANESGNIRFRDYDGSNRIDNSAVWNHSADTWYRIEAVRNGNDFEVFVDKSSFMSWTDSSSFLNRSDPLEIGANNAISYFMDGIMDEVRITVGEDRGSAWRNASYESETDNLLTFGTEQENVGEQTGSEDLQISDSATITPVPLSEDQTETLQISDEITFDAISETEDLQISDSATITPVPLKETQSEDLEISDSITVQNVVSTNNGTKIISIDSSTLIAVTDESPANLIKIDISDQANPEFSTFELTGANNALDVSYNSQNGFLYIACADGTVKKAEFSNLSNQSTVDLSDTDNLEQIETLGSEGLSHASTTDTTGELYLIDERSTFKLDSDIHFLISERFKLDSDFKFLGNGVFRLNSDFQFLAEETFKIESDIKFLSSPIDEIEPIKETDFQVFIDGVELNDTDLKLNSIEIILDQEEKDQAQFTLARKHDQLNTTLEGDTVQITNNNSVEIKIDGVSKFTGKITRINAVYEAQEERVDIFAEGNEPTYEFRNLTLALPGLNKRLGLYDVMIQNPIISKPVLDPDADDPLEFGGVKVDLGTKTIQRVTRLIDFDSFGTIAEQIQDGEFNPVFNWTYFWSPTAEKFGTVNLGEISTVNAFYIGTSLSPISDDLWNLTRAAHRRQRQFDDKEEDLGEYTVGQAPFREISSRNGQTITKWRWEDRDGGLYSVKDEAHNHIDFAKEVADLEYEKMKNINGNLFPRTKCNIILTVDALLFYDIQILNRINIDNTTEEGIYKNSNGFPVSVKKIVIRSQDRKAELVCDNSKSTKELEDIDGQFPDENADEYNDPEKVIFIDPKIDLNTGLGIE